MAGARWLPHCRLRGRFVRLAIRSTGRLADNQGAAQEVRRRPQPGTRLPRQAKRLSLLPSSSLVPRRMGAHSPAADDKPVHSVTHGVNIAPSRPAARHGTRQPAGCAVWRRIGPYEGRERGGVAPLKRGAFRFRGGPSPHVPQFSRLPLLRQIERDWRGAAVRSGRLLPHSTWCACHRSTRPEHDGKHDPET